MRRWVFSDEVQFSWTLNSSRRRLLVPLKRQELLSQRRSLTSLKKKILDYTAVTTSGLEEGPKKGGNIFSTQETIIYAGWNMLREVRSSLRLLTAPFLHLDRILNPASLLLLLFLSNGPEEEKQKAWYCQDSVSLPSKVNFVSWWLRPLLRICQHMRLYTIDVSLISEWRNGNGLEGTDRGLMEVLPRHQPGATHTNQNSRCPAKIRKKCFPNTSFKRYRYINLLGDRFFVWRFI